MIIVPIPLKPGILLVQPKDECLCKDDLIPWPLPSRQRLQTEPVPVLQAVTDEQTIFRQAAKRDLAQSGRLDKLLVSQN